MARINLLPWREAERKERQQEFGFMVLAGVVLSGLAVFGIHMLIEGQITAQNQRNSFLEREISSVESQIREIEELDRTKQNLLARMNVIQELQSSRPQIVHLFDEIVTALPDGVYLNKVTQDGNKVAFEGRAQSNARVSSLMRNIESSEWIGKPKLDLIESKEKTGTGYSHFKLTASQLTQAGEGDK
ncbi:MAG: PilN domain-containing protein [Candidatus Thiodiazotropha sp. (ex Monitilora ramsayi)]|nr:PilN domain-containing protein [Candidatus Thiodiazotropha sp. (ex Monitilora ramsayi)]